MEFMRWKGSRNFCRDEVLRRKEFGLNVWRLQKFYTKMFWLLIFVTYRDAPGNAPNGGFSLQTLANEISCKMVLLCFYTRDLVHYLPALDSLVIAGPSIIPHVPWATYLLPPPKTRTTRGDPRWKGCTECQLHRRSHTITRIQVSPKITFLNPSHLTHI